MKALHRSRIDRVSIAPYSPGKGEKEKKGNRGRKRDADRLDWFESETAVALVAQQPHKGGQKWHDGAFTRALFAGTIAYRYTRARSSRKLQPIARKRAHASSEKERERERERERGGEKKRNPIFKCSFFRRSSESSRDYSPIRALRVNPRESTAIHEDET